jgi:hypothetical protein
MKKVMMVCVAVVIAFTTVTESQANIGGFTPDMTGWSLQGYPPAASYWRDGIICLKQNDYYASASAFYTIKQDVSSFTASFIWFTGIGYDGYNPGDGFTFVVQNAGTGYLGAVGGGLGYAGMPNSTGLAFNMMNNSIALAQNGGIGSYAPVNPVVLHSLVNAMQVTVTYDGSNLAATLVDPGTGASFRTSYAINIAQTIGTDMAYVGFTGGSGRAYGNQFVGDFSFNSVPEPATLLLLGLGGLLLSRRKNRNIFSEKSFL